MLMQALSGDTFKMEEMTAAILKVPFVPGRVGALNIFRTKGVRTRTIQVDFQEGFLSLIPNTAVGAPPHQNKKRSRNTRNFVIPHFPVEDAILAAELQDVRAFGGNALQGLAQLRDERLTDMRAKHDATLEYGRLGAVKGIILDSDGSTEIYDLFDEFGLTQTTVDFLLGTSTTEMKAKCYAVKRAIETELGGATYTGIRVLCGGTWFERFTTHPVVKAAYDRWLDGAALRDDNRRGFEFCGIIFEEYRGTVGGVDFIAASEAHAFPEGVSGLFETYFAPGDFVESVNTPGLPMYAKAEVMPYDRGIKMLTESNPLSICTRPKVLIKLTTGN